MLPFHRPSTLRCTAAQVARAALEMLSVLHEEAAAQNDKLHLFASEERFPRVFQLAAELAGAEAALEGLLPGLRRQLGLPRLVYISLANQGDYLIEVPADRRDVPKVGDLSSSRPAHVVVKAAVQASACRSPDPLYG